MHVGAEREMVEVSGARDFATSKVKDLATVETVDDGKL